MNDEHERAPAEHCATLCVTQSEWPPAWDSVRASCTPPVRLTRAAPTAAYSCRLPATMPRILPVPGQKYTFGMVKAAQARGDFQVLAERGRRALRVHLGKDMRPAWHDLRRHSSKVCANLPRRTARVQPGVLVFSQSNMLHDLEKRFNMEKERIMRLGMVGLGKMGANMTRRLMRGGHEVVVTDLSADNVKKMAGEGAIASSSLDDFASKLGKPRIAWLMVPAGAPTEQTVEALAQRMQAGDILIDGGNTYFKDDVRRSAKLRKKEFTTSTSAPAAVSGAWSAVTA